MATGLKLADAPGGERRVVAMIGFMGAGKSTAARSAAEALGASAVDVDHVIEQRLGKPIDRVFSEDGERAFRQTEERVTLELLSAPGTRVLALGGGAVGSRGGARRARRASRRLDRRRLRDRLAALQGDRAGRWPRDRGQFERLYREREPLYEQLAEIVVGHERSHRMAEVLGAPRACRPAR